MIQIIAGLSGAFLIVGTLLWLIHRERKKNRYSPFTEKTLRSPGHTLSIELDDLTDSFLFPLILMAFIPLIYFLAIPENTNLLTHAFSAIFILPIIVLVFIHSQKTFTKIQKVRLGLFGEIYTGQELNYLMRQGAWVYHDIPYKYGNIDHVVISKAGIFAIETKAVSKPTNKNGGKDATVFITKKSIKFPHYTTSDPINQAKRHADYLNKSFSRLLTRTGCPVYSVVALPGWNVVKENKNEKDGFLVINPKRGDWLKKYLNQKERLNKKELVLIVDKIEGLARSVEAKSNITDPDAKRNYSFFLHRKHEEYKL